MNFKMVALISFSLCLPALSVAQRKIIQISSSSDFSFKYLPPRTESAQLDISYINFPSDSTQANYTVKYKPKGSSKFKGTEPILLKSPIDFEALKKELNNKLQIEGDTVVRALSNNSIYELAYILDTIRFPLDERTVSGDFILNNYIKIFKDSDEPNHQVRQELVQYLTQPLTRLNLQVDSLNSAVIAMERLRVKNNKEISDLEESLLNNDLAKKKIEVEKATLEENIRRFVSDSTRLSDGIKLKSRTILQQNVDSDELDSYQSLLNSVIKRIPNDSTVNSQTKDTLNVLGKLMHEKAPSVMGLKHIPLQLDTLTIGNQFAVTKEKIIADITETALIVRNAVNSKKERATIAANEKSKLQDQLSSSTTDRSKVNEAMSMIDKKLSKVEVTVLKADIEGLQIDNRNLELKIGSFKKRLKILNDSIRAQTVKLVEASIFQIDRVSVQIERGFIERIQVNVPTKHGDQYDIYENIFAIGFSSIKNFKKFANTKLVSRLSNDFIYLSDVIANYDNLLKSFTRDFSPADTTINHFNPRKGFIRLSQDQFMNLFDARIYTDILGLKDNRPNGLVQIELARKFNILTSRRQIKTDRTDWGAFTYLNIFGSLNKIENNNKYLLLKNEDVVSGGQLVSPFYATNLDFKLYQSLSLGTEANLFLFDWPDGKVTSYLDFGLSYGQTPLIFNKRTVSGNSVLQSERDSSLLAHSSTLYPKLTLEVFSEKRVRLSMSYQYNTTRLYSNNNFKAISSYRKSDLTNLVTEYDARRSHMIEFNLIASPTSTKNGRFFFRARYFIQQGDHNTFFSQIQFGYSYNLRLKKFEI